MNKESANELVELVNTLSDNVSTLEALEIVGSSNEVYEASHAKSNSQSGTYL
jgi:hypothetical protein